MNKTMEKALQQAYIDAAKKTLKENVKWNISTPLCALGWDDDGNAYTVDVYDYTLPSYGRHLEIEVNGKSTPLVDLEVNEDGEGLFGGFSELYDLCRDYPAELAALAEVNFSADAFPYHCEKVLLLRSMCEAVRA